MIQLNTYENYLSSPDTLPFETANSIHMEVIQEANINDTIFNELWEEVIESAITYTKNRAEWRTYTRERKVETDKLRTGKHNRFIVSLTVLKRYMNTQNWSTSWSNQLGLEEREKNRKKIGDFANYLTYVYALNGR